MSEPASKVCPECGLRLPAGGADAGCPGCSLRLALSPEALTPLKAKRPLPPGLKSRFFGDYEILDEIARGGMGVVYRARQLGLNRLVALKMVQSHQLISDEARLRFRVEIEAVAQLHHPHIVSLYESGEEDGAHFFTMRLVEGGDLAANLRRERPVRERIRQLVKVCRAVHYAHQRGILHRDLKPSNILVDELGEPHVVDFGLAKSLDQDSGFTFTSSVLGSPNYMAPEQATGKTRQLTTAVDVYGLGAILYHILAGQPPFQAATPIETLRQVADLDPVPPRTLSPSCDPDLETIALKCVRKDPAERYGSAEELAQDLERWLDGRPILARPLGPLAVAWRWSRRHPVATALGGALGLALLVIVVGTALGVVRIRDAEEKSAASLRESLLREAGSLRLGGELGNRAEGLKLLREAVALGGSPEFRRRARNELLATVARTDLEFAPLTFTNLPLRYGRWGFHPLFQAVCGIQDGTNIVFRRLGDDAPLGYVQSMAGELVSVDTFDPSARHLAVWMTNALAVFELKSGKNVLTVPGTNVVFAFHPREESILIQTNPNEIVWIDLSSGLEHRRWRAPIPRLGGRKSGWHTLAFSPDGQSLAGASETSRLVEFMDPETGRQTRTVTNSAHAVALAWSRRGNLFAVATADHRIQLWDTPAGALRWTSPAMVAEATSLAFHPRGDWLVAACADEHVRIVDIATERIVFEHPGRTDRIGFSPGGTRFGPLEWRGQWGQMRFQKPPEFTGFDLGESDVRLKDARFSPDGAVLAVGHVDMVVLCDPKRGARLRTRNDWQMSAFEFLPDGGEVIAADSSGIVRYHMGFPDPRRLNLAAGDVIHPGRGWQAFDLSADGRFFAAFNALSNQALIFDRTLTNRLATVGLHTGAASIVISPDGHWLATGSRDDRSLKVWDVAAEKLVLTIPAGLQPRAVFSPDGRWLLAMDAETFELRETGTWTSRTTVRTKLPGRVFGVSTFSPDGRMLAVVTDRFAVNLFDLERAEILGTLRAPVATTIHGIAFSPDNSQLAVVGDESRIAVWHLGPLRQRLAEFGLGWDAAAHPATP